MPILPIDWSHSARSWSHRPVGKSGFTVQTGSRRRLHRYLAHDLNYCFLFGTGGKAAKAGGSIGSALRLKRHTGGVFCSFGQGL